MIRIHKTLHWVFLVCAACVPGCAQDTQFLPEIQTNLRLSSLIRVNLDVKGDREGGSSIQSQTGGTIEFHLKPLVKLKSATTYDNDDSKQRFLVLQVGYTYLIAPNTAPTNRMYYAATSNYVLPAAFVISDQSRFDTDWQASKYTWRYQNKFTLERTVPIFSYHFIPYAAVEPYYESQYKKVSTTALYAGALFPVGKHVQFDLYYEHENNTGKKTNKQDNDIGLSLDLYFARKQ
jgi:hypothetical protein